MPDPNVTTTYSPEGDTTSALAGTHPAGLSLFTHILSKAIGTPAAQTAQEGINLGGMGMGGGTGQATMPSGVRMTPHPEEMWPQWKRNGRTLAPQPRYDFEIMHPEGYPMQKLTGHMNPENQMLNVDYLSRSGAGKDPRMSMTLSEAKSIGQQLVDFFKTMGMRGVNYTPIDMGLGGRSRLFDMMLGGRSNPVSPRNPYGDRTLMFDQPVKGK